jgi:hypothetical protein
MAMLMCDYLQHAKRYYGVEAWSHYTCSSEVDRVFENTALPQPFFATIAHTDWLRASGYKSGGMCSSWSYDSWTSKRSTA